MDLKIDGKYRDVNFWSFLKCHIFAYLMVMSIFVIIGLFFGLIGLFLV